MGFFREMGERFDKTPVVAIGIPMIGLTTAENVKAVGKVTGKAVDTISKGAKHVMHEAKDAVLDGKIFETAGKNVDRLFETAGHGIKNAVKIMSGAAIGGVGHVAMSDIGKAAAMSGVATGAAIAKTPVAQGLVAGITGVAGSAVGHGAIVGGMTGVANGVSGAAITSVGSAGKALAEHIREIMQNAHDDKSFDELKGKRCIDKFKEIESKDKKPLSKEFKDLMSGLSVETLGGMSMTAVGAAAGAALEGASLAGAIKDIETEDVIVTEYPEMTVIGKNENYRVAEGRDTEAVSIDSPEL